jgi:hypothetical protein
MGFKKTNSPIKQFGLPGSVISNMVNQQGQVPQGGWGGSLMGMPVGTIPQPATAAAIGAQQQPINSGSMMSNMATRISPVNPNIGGPGAGNFTNDLSRSITPRTNMNTRPQAPINPKALGNNTRTIANMYGRNMPGSFDRNMGPLMQMTDPLTGQVIDPTMDQSTAGMNPVVQGDTAIAPPEGVEVPITPIYDINQ